MRPRPLALLLWAIILYLHLLEWFQDFPEARENTILIEIEFQFQLEKFASALGTCPGPGPLPVAHLTALTLPPKTSPV